MMRDQRMRRPARPRASGAALIASVMSEHEYRMASRYRSRIRLVNRARARAALTDPSRLANGKLIGSRGGRGRERLSPASAARPSAYHGQKMPASAPDARLSVDGARNADRSETSQSRAAGQRAPQQPAAPRARRR